MKIKRSHIRLNGNCITFLVISVFMFLAPSFTKANTKISDYLTEIQQQTSYIQGKVVDSRGEALYGATVFNAKTNSGATVGSEGTFRLEVNIGDELTISYIGYITKKVVIKNTKELIITLDEEIRMMDEVVVTGMSISREKKSLGYSSQEVKSEDLSRTRQSSIGSALIGKVSGVRFLSPAGSSFDGASVVLRGTSSIALNSVRGNSPIYVIDGIITSESSVNMDDVESLNVLKGPAATALYGSRGGNGAIIISTIKGRGEMQEISITHSTVFDTHYQHANLQSEYGGGTLAAGDGRGKHLQFQFDPTKHIPEYSKLDGAYYYDMTSSNQSWGPKFDKDVMYAPWYAWDPQHPLFGQQIPWQAASKSEVNKGLRTAPTHTTNVSVSKGGKDYYNRISFTNLERRGIVPNSNDTRRFFSLKTSYTVFDKLTLDGDYKYTYANRMNTGTNAFLAGYPTSIARDLSINNLKGYRRADGGFNHYIIKNPATEGDYVVQGNNPFALMNEQDATNNRHTNLISGAARYDILSNLFVRLMVNTELSSTTQKSKVPQGLLGTTAGFSESQQKIRDTQVQGQLAYNTKFFEDRFKWDINLFLEQRDYRSESLSAGTVGGLLVDKLYNISGSIDKPTAANTLIRFQEKSAFGTTTLSFDDTYYVEFTLRNDWSSTLPKRKDNFLYGGASFSYILSNHVKASWIDFIKLRGSLAEVGSSLTPYQLSEIYNLQKYGGLNTISQASRYIDDKLKPTISTSYELGTEFSFFNNRITGDFNFYTRDSKNQVITLPMSHQSGYDGMLTNAGLIRNSGFEITIGIVPIQTKDFTWSLSANLTKNKNKLVELNKHDKTLRTFQQNYASYGDTFVVQWAEVGEPIGVIRGTDFERVDGKIVLTKRNPNDVSGIATNGEYNIELNRSEKNYLGNSQPNALGGLSTQLTYKDFTLAGTLDFQLGGKVASVTNLYGEARGHLKSTVGKNSLNKDIRLPYSEGGGVDIVGVIQTGVDSDNNPIYEDVKTRMGAFQYFNTKRQVWGPNIYNASYAKIRELSLSYNVPRKWLDKIHKDISAVNLSLIATNPFTIYSGVPNVDVSDTAGGGGAGFFESGNILSTRSFGFTVNVTF